MTDKIVIDRDFLEHAVVALEYAYNTNDEMVMESIKYLRAALAQKAEPDEQEAALQEIADFGQDQEREPRTREEKEQYAFEDWLASECPSGSVEAVQSQWEESAEYLELQDDTPAQPADIVNPISQQEPVAWRHSKTGRLYDSVEEVPLADGDEWAEPLYATPATQQAPAAWRQWSTKRHDWDYQTDIGDLRPDTPAEPLFLAAAQPAEQCPVKSYWLIECKNGFTGWYTGKRLDCRFFDTDPRKAYKFASKELAENEISERGHSCMIATEHVDIAAQPALAAVPPKLWLWKNFVDGRPEYWAFDNPFPIHMDYGDPQTLGEPCGYAIFKPSRTGRTDVSEAEVLRRVAAAIRKGE